MLIIKNISKTYTTKGGVTHRAIENVSVSFEDHGMVFILGKSGSGKSTLLNIIAGIDTFDRGEMYLGNRSFSSFTNKEFNSYRNTIIGFVFQEYHLVDAYHAYDNIRLSLALQSKIDPDAIQNSLQKYEIENLAKRKTFELSGGQQQRVAIARALVKNPKIILADEPSGALDEVTAKEIFNILKELSKERLVIVVSHNRELADTYGDRIIELKDGEILKDLANNVTDQKSEEPELIARSIYKFPANQVMTEHQVDQLNDLFKQNPRDYYLSVEQQPLKVKSMYPHLKEAIEKKDDANEQFKQYIYPKNIKENDISFSKANLPIKDAFKLGMKNIRKKLVSFIILLIISISSLFIYGLSVNFNNYDRNLAIAMTTKHNDIPAYYLSSGYSTSYLRDAQAEKVDERFSKNAKYYDSSLTLYANERQYDLNEYGYLESDDFVNYYNLSYSFKSSKYQFADNGIIISSYLAAKIQSYNLPLLGQNDIEKLHDSLICINDIYMRVVGIYEFDLSPYQEIIGLEYPTSQREYDLIQEFTQLREMHLGRIFISKGQMKAMMYNTGIINNVAIFNPDNDSEVISRTNFSATKTLLSDNSITYIDPTVAVTSNYTITATPSIFNILFGKTPDYFWDYSIEEIKEFIDQFNATPNRFIIAVNNTASIVIENLQISKFTDSYVSYICISENIFHELVKTNSRPNRILAFLNKDSISAILSDVNFFNANNLILSNHHSDIINFATDIIENLEFIVNFLRVFFLLLVTLLLYIFLSSSIKKNKKQIGIIRALGANQSDIFKIFVSEAIIIGGIAAGASCLLYTILGNIANATLSKPDYIPLFQFQFGTYLQMVIITLVVVAIALIIPIIKLSHMKIVDLIQKSE